MPNKKKLKIRSSLNYEVGKHRTFKKPSKTIPDESYTVRQIMERHTGGLINDELYREGQYEEYNDIDDHNPLRDPDFDLTDIQKVKDELKITEEKIQKAKNQKQKVSNKVDTIQPVDGDQAEQEPDMTKTTNESEAEEKNAKS